MSTKNKISIITPSFNSELFIEDCIRSVKDQHYENYEHIIVDGGSTDGTVEILKKYPHLKWVSEHDDGQSDALNKGFMMASGEIVGWCNSDDVYLSGTFNRVSTILSEENIDGVYSNLYFSDYQLNITRKIISHKPIKWLSLFHCFIPSATFFFRRKIIDNGILIDRTKHITMDKDFFAAILYSNYRIVYVSEYFAIFRWHKDNKSNDSFKIKQIRIKEGVDIFNKHSSFKIPNNSFTQVVYYFIDDYLLNVLKLFLKKRTAT